MTDARRSPKFDLDNEGEQQIQNILEVVNREPLSLSFMQLAWTAGPITYLALLGGYWISYGKTPPPELFVYFAGYTVIAGLLAIMVRILYNARQLPRQKRDDMAMHTLHGILPDLILGARNDYLAGLSPEAKRMEATLPVLKNPQAETDAVAQAVQDLTGNRVLFETVRRVEVYRRSGMPSYVQDIVAENHKDVADAVIQLARNRPDLSEWLARRLRGEVPTLQRGLRRSEGFLERIFAMGETDNTELLRQHDLEELFTLAFELICGREVPLLFTRFRGRRRMASEMHKLNALRNRYRVVLAARFSRLKAIARYLEEHGHAQDHPNRYRINANAILRHIHTDIGRLCDTIQDHCRTLNRESGWEERRTLRAMTRDLRNLIELYKALIDAHRETGIVRERLHESLKRWAQMTRRKNLGLVMNERSRGIRISVRRVRLNDREKLQFARGLAPFLESWQARYSPHRHKDNEEDYKKLAIEIMRQLEPLIFIGSPETQRAIEWSRAPNLSCIEPSFSAQAKAALGKAAVDEIVTDPGPQAERLLQALILQFGFQPDPDSIRFISENFGAREDVLQHLAETCTPGAHMPALSPLEKMPEKPVLHRAWQQTLERANAVLKAL